MLILLSGWKGSGKDLAAAYLAEKFGAQRITFAAALKDMVSEQYNVPRHYFDDRNLKEMSLIEYPIYNKDGFSNNIHQYMKNEHPHGYHTPRSLAILEGSVKRSVDPNYWVKRAVKDINPEKLYVVTDWRYNSEYEALLDFKPLTARINRFETTTSTDPSERDLDNFDFDCVIENQGTVKEFLEKVYELGTLYTLGYQKYDETK